MGGFFAAENVIDIQNVVAVFVVVAVVLDSLARFRENTSWVLGRLIFERRVANAVRCRQVGRKRLERLQIRQYLQVAFPARSTYTNETAFRVGATESWLCVNSSFDLLRRFDFSEPWHGASGDALLRMLVSRRSNVTAKHVS